MSAATLHGRRLLVSAGPTYEDLDPVRFLGNRSSGKMGFAIAAAAARRGAAVVLVAGPAALATPPGVTRIDVRSAAQMHAAVLAALPADVYIGAAAVADYTPRQVAAGKIKKHGARLTLELVRTADILADVAAHSPRPALVVGFAAETEDVAANARAAALPSRYFRASARADARSGATPVANATRTTAPGASRMRSRSAPIGSRTAPVVPDSARPSRTIGLAGERPRPMKRMRSVS